MWLYIPREYCLSSPESVDLIARYGLFFQNVELYVTSSGKPMPRPYSWQGWKTRPWMKLLYGVTLQPSTVTASMDSWIQSLSVSPVPTSQLQASKKESAKAQDQDSSLKPAELFAKYSQGIFLSKTSQDSFLTDSCQSYSENFPKWGSMHSGECFRQEMWVAPILEKESSFWGTPTVDAISDRKNKYAQGGTPIAMQASSWPTPRKSEPEGGVVENTKFENGSFSRVNQQGVRFGVKLKDAVSAWPTPAMRDYKGTYNTIVRKDGKCRLDQLANASIYTGPLAQAKQKSGNESSNSDPTSPQPLKKRLNPNFCEWLMGVPLGWSLPTPIDQNAYKLWETESAYLLEQLH